MKKKIKRYEDGGLTFAEMDDADREAMAKARMAEMGGPMPEEPKRVTRAKKVNAGDISENLRDLEMQGADTGYSSTEYRRNAARVGTEHASGKKKTDADKYASAKPGSGGPSREIKPANKGALRDLYDTFKNGPKLMKSGGKVSSASKRADGCAVRGKTKGRIV